MRFGIRERLNNRKRKAVGVLLTFALLLMNPASAATYSVNWTEISNLISGVASVFPGFIDLVTNVLPVVVIIAIIGFVVKFLDRILAMLSIGRIFK